MTSDKKRFANKANAQKSTGPRTVRGKRNSSRNSLKTGLFARHLYVPEGESLVFDQLRMDLSRQLTPETPLQRLAFDRAITWGWYGSLSCKAISDRIRELRACRGPANLDPDAPKSNSELLRWFGSGRSELNAGMRVLQQLRVDISQSGGHVRELWKDHLTACFGPQLYALLREWSPTNPCALQLTRQIMAHSENFNMPIPELKENPVYVRDPQQEQEMVLKLVDLYIEFLAAGMKIVDEGRLGAHEISRAENIDFTHFSKAMKEFEAAVEWLLWLKGVGL